MSEVLKNLVESRDAAMKAFEDFVAEVRDGKSDLTPEQVAEKRGELRAALDELDERIDEETELRARNAKLAEVRKSLGDAEPAAKPNLQVSEPTTYGPDSPHSYFADLASASSPIFKQHRAALQRLERASHEVAVEMVQTASPEKRRRIEAIVREDSRNNDESARAALEQYRALGATGRSELRTGMDTTSGSGGSFATPVYLVQEYAPYREAGRAFIDQCNHMPLPDYGMTVYLPHVTGPAAIAAQAEAAAVTETDPTAGYLSDSLTTEAGQVTVSQQILDRAGPGFAFDRLVFDQLNRDYAPKVDTLAITKALANAGTVTYTDSTGFHLTAASGSGGFYSKVSGAKSAIRTTAGVFLNPSHLFVAPNRWEYISAWSDANGRPLVVPDYAGPNNAAAGGSADGAGVIEGRTGYRLNGLPVFTDNNLPTPTVGADIAVVGDLAEVYVFEGTPVTRALPQTLGGNLQVILQMYGYIAVISRYGAGIQQVKGSGMSTITF